LLDLAFVVLVLAVIGLMAGYIAALRRL